MTACVLSVKHYVDCIYFLRSVIILSMDKSLYIGTISKGICIPILKTNRASQTFDEIRLIDFSRHCRSNILINNFDKKDVCQSSTSPSCIFVFLLYHHSWRYVDPRGIIVASITLEMNTVPRYNYIIHFCNVDFHAQAAFIKLMGYESWQCPIS